VRHGSVAALVGWTPSAGIITLSATLAEVGATVVPLPRPPAADPPTMLHREGASGAFAPLVETYATVPYRDVDPTVLAGLAYVVMFGVMFGDVGHGGLILLGALLIRAGWPRRLAWLRPRWLFVAGAGLTSMLAGLAYGEFFGPTGLVPVSWLSPLDEPIPLLVAGVSLGAVLLASAYALGTVNRVREGGWSFALYAPSGIAGSLLFLAAGLVASGWYGGVDWLSTLGAALASAALVLAFLGRSGCGPGTGVVRGGGRGADRRRHRGRRVLDRGLDRRGVHRRGGARGDERAARAVRSRDGHRRAGRRNRHLRPDRRDHPYRTGLSHEFRRPCRGPR